MHPAEWILANAGRRFKRPWGDTIYLAREYRFCTYGTIGHPFIYFERERDGVVIPIAWAVVLRMVPATGPNQVVVAGRQGGMDA